VLSSDASDRHHTVVVHGPAMDDAAGAPNGTTTTATYRESARMGASAHSVVPSSVGTIRSESKKPAGAHATHDGVGVEVLLQERDALLRQLVRLSNTFVA
jgi:hypothetical protein